MVRDKGLDILLELNGIEYRLNNNYWVKFEIYQVAEVTSQVPHGIRYSLTLHDRYNKRIMGFDNAHAVKTDRKKYSGYKKTWDHKHEYPGLKTTPYEFISAEQLLEDFWQTVNEIIEKSEKSIHYQR